MEISSLNTLLIKEAFNLAHPPQLIFGLGKSEKTDSLLIQWPGGHIQRIYNSPVNQILTIKESDAKPENQLKQELRPLLKEILGNQKLGLYS